MREEAKDVETFVEEACEEAKTLSPLADGMLVECFASR